MCQHRKRGVLGMEGWKNNVFEKIIKIMTFKILSFLKKFKPF